MMTFVLLIDQTLTIFFSLISSYRLICHLPHSPMKPRQKKLKFIELKKIEISLTTIDLKKLRNQFFLYKQENKKNSIKKAFLEKSLYLEIFVKKYTFLSHLVNRRIFQSKYKLNQTKRHIQHLYWFPQYLISMLASLACSICPAVYITIYEVSAKNLPA